MRGFLGAGRDLGDEFPVVIAPEVRLNTGRDGALEACRSWRAERTASKRDLQPCIHSPS
jgi:hypothetical protein